MRFFNYLIPVLFITTICFLGSCTIREDPGPMQYSEQPFAMTDFDRLDIGDAMFVTVTRGNLYSVSAKGDRRNLDDLEVTKVGNTLVTRFNKNRSRRHTTYITITMPALTSANFYGATTSTIGGFEESNFTLNLSGASLAQIDLIAEASKFNLSGASNLTLSGSSKMIAADLSGASLLKAYTMAAEDVNVIASGASHAYVRATKSIVAEASGASSILYRGDATVTAKTSGASTIVKD